MAKLLCLVLLSAVSQRGLAAGLPISPVRVGSRVLGGGQQAEEYLGRGSELGLVFPLLSRSGRLHLLGKEKGDEGGEEADTVLRAAPFRQR